MFFIISAEAQTKKKDIIMSKNSLTKEEMAKVNPKFLDTIYRQTTDGNILMTVEVSKNLDTAYVENPITGVINMIVSRKKSPFDPKPTTYKKGDTAYVEDPVTGKIHMVISD